MSWLNYHHLQCFVAVVEEGGLVPAARRLGVTHPTISAQIKQLESNVGLNLFLKRGRRLQLTEDGQMVYGFAGQIFGIGASLIEAVEGRRSGRDVLLRVGIDSVLPKLAVRQVLTPLLDAFAGELRLRCLEDERSLLLGMLRGRRLDLVLSDAPDVFASSEPLRSVELLADGVGLFGAAGLVPEDGEPFPRSLDGCAFLLPMPATRIRRDLERWLGDHRIRPRVVGEFADSGLLKHFAQDGRGVFAMPIGLAEDVCRQYSVQMLGAAEGVTTHLHAVAREEAHLALGPLFGR